MAISTIPEAIEDIKNGKMIILVDDEDRENEGDLCMASEFVTPEAINFMAKHGRGLICLTLNEELAQKINLHLMVNDNQSRFKTAFTVSIEARRGVTTGISAHDRATTIRTAIADNVKPDDIVSPGHVFPILARKGGVLVRTGQTEGSVDLARLAGLKPSGVICEIMKDDGTMARMPDLEIFAKEHGLKIVTIADLINFRMKTESFVRRAATATLPTAFGGDFKFIVYENDVDEMKHVALVKGEISPERRRARPGALRVHDGRRLRVHALRLRRPAPHGHGDHQRGRQGRHRLHAPGGPGNRTCEQGQGL